MTNENRTTEAISGRATGALFFSGFGCLWLCTGLAAMHRLNLISGLFVAILLIGLVGPAILLLKRIPKAGQVSRAGDEQISKTFNRVNMIQWVGVAAAVLLLNIVHKPEFIVPAIAIIVGLHLFPLAKLFQYPAHYVTGTLLVVWSVGVVLLFSKEKIASIGALGTAAILLLSAAYTLTTATLAARQVLQASERV